MSTTASVQRVRIYLSEHDEWGGLPLYQVILDRLRHTGATGATAMRGLAGFGPSHLTRATGVIDLHAHPPVVIEWIDRVERVASILPQLDELLPNALTTIEDVQLYRAVLRGRGPFAGEDRVRDYMRPTLRTLTTAATLSQALDILMNADQTTIPIIDDQRRVVGTLTGQDIVLRTGLRLPPNLLRLLNEDEYAALLAPLADRSITEIMSHDPRSIYAGAPIPQAMVPLIEWNYDQIPVLDDRGALVGLLGQEEVLSAAIAHEETGSDEIRDADPPTPVSLVMQKAIPQVVISEPMAVALQHLLTSSDHTLMVVDAASRLQGRLSIANVLRQLQGEERTTLLAALQSGRPVDAPGLPGTDRDFYPLLERDFPTIAPTETMLNAIRLLLAQREESIPVVDEDGKLLGKLSQGSLLRALAQASE
jgi:CBS-domain-containing membrane protein